MKYLIDKLYAYRYYDKENGPLATVSSLTLDEMLQKEYRRFDQDELKVMYKYRIEKEHLLKFMFEKKGGQPAQYYPYYFAIRDQNQANHPLEFRYGEAKCISIPLYKFAPKSVSFTYGTSNFALSRRDYHPTRRKIYLINEIEDIINQYGLIPNDHYPSCLEMQVWDNTVLKSCYLSGKYEIQCTNEPIKVQEIEKKIQKLQQTAADIKACTVEDFLYNDLPYGHGYNHAQRVWLLCLELANLYELSSTESRLLSYCAVYHDIGRTDNKITENHGQLSFLKVIKNQYHIKQWDNEELEIIRFIIENHCIDDAFIWKVMDGYNLEDKQKAYKLLKIFKDADGLDRCRMNDLDIEMLRTEAAKKTVRFAYELLKVIK